MFLKGLFQNGTNDISEMAHIIHSFWQKHPNFVQFGSSDFVQILPALVKIASKDYKYYLEFMLLATAMDYKRALTQKSV